MRRSPGSEFGTASSTNSSATGGEAIGHLSAEPVMQHESAASGGDSGSSGSDSGSSVDSSVSSTGSSSNVGSWSGPTVVTVHGGLYRALTFGRHALYADPFDKEDLGITMFKVLRHPRLRDRLARMGAHKARSLFTWTGIAQQLVAVVEQRASVSLALSDTEWDEPWNDAD